MGLIFITILWSRLNYFLNFKSGNWGLERNVENGGIFRM